MSILATQALGGQISNPGRTYSSSQNPFPVRDADAVADFNNFHGFRYAADAESRDAFGLQIQFTGPTEAALFQSLSEEATTYGTAGQFTKLADTESTVLTQMAKFVNDGSPSEGEEAPTYANTKMENSFSTGNGTRTDIARGQYQNSEGWRISLDVEGRFDRGNPYQFKSDIDLNNAVIPRPEGGSDAGGTGDTAEGSAEPAVVEDKQEQLTEPGGGGGGETSVADANQQYRDNFNVSPPAGSGFGWP